MGRVRRRPGEKSHGKGATGGPKWNRSPGEGEEWEGGGLVRRSQELQGSSAVKILVLNFSSEKVRLLGKRGPLRIDDEAAA